MASSHEHHHEDAPADSLAAAPTLHRPLVALLDYIEQVERLALKPTPVVPAEFYCAYEEELRDLPGVAFDLTKEGDETWLRVPRVEPSDPPAAPAELSGWSAGGTTPDAPPTLRADRTPDDPAALEAALATWRDGPWAQWARNERAQRATIRAWQRLHSIHRLIETEGVETPLELVWGIGIVAWRHPGGRTIVHPLATMPVEVRLDARTLDLEVRPRQMPPALELTAFKGLSLSGLETIESGWRALQEEIDGGISPFDLSGLNDWLRNAATALDPSGQFLPDVRGNHSDRSLPDRRAHPTVTDTWVLYARRRAPHFLIEDAERLKQQIGELERAGTALPAGPAALVAPVADTPRAESLVQFRGLSYVGGRPSTAARKSADTGGDPTTGPDTAPAIRELYFPKPYNAEQVSIIQKLEQADGVVVQGPPGTGKTHTIANIICHYLASGKRVLVTSKGDAALAVLREHIPEGIRPLAVALLTDEKDGMAQFEEAVQSIATNVARIDIADAERAADALAVRVDELHTRIAAVDQELTRWAALHLRRVRFMGRDMLPDELARHVIEHRTDCDWLTDRLSIQSNAPRFTAADIASARKARVAIGRDIVYLGIDLPAYDRLPDGPAIAALHEGLLQARRLAARIRDERTPPLVDTGSETLLQASSLRGAVAQAVALFDHASHYNADRTARLYRLYHDEQSPARQHLDSVLAELGALDGMRQAFVSRPVDVPPNGEVDPKFVDTVARAALGKRPFGLLSIGKSELRARLDSVRVAGLAPRDTADWSHAHAWIQYLQHARAALTRWNAMAAETGLDPVDPDDPDASRAAIAQAEHIVLVRRIVTDLEPGIDADLPKLFGAGLRLSACGDGRNGLVRLIDILDRNLQQAELASVMPTYSALLNFCTGRGGPVLTAMRTFLADELGRRDLSNTQVAERWGGLRAELRRLAGMRQAFARLERVADLVAASGAPSWADKLRTVPARDANDPWTRPDWLDAWHWRQVATLLDSIDGRDALARLQRTRSDLESDLSRAYQRLVEARTWVQVCRNSPDTVKAALQAYLNAVMHIGRGGGLRASRYRREARRAMQHASPAVPCWIMPHWRVSETLPANIGHFDLVVVDEASQSDLWALPCLLRGTKLLIVGDDRQVAPDPTLLGEEAIRALRDRYLDGQAHATQMSAEKSLYDLARVVFAGSMVMLREHFRCVAPIIEFSRREFYRDEIRPLRIPRPSERLDPPLVDILVRGATRRGHINEAEARAIVAEIRSIIADPRCAGRSIGVVSLAGLEQAQHIFDVIRDVIDPADVVARRITVGDARTFQGKERDIMLVSMVTTSEDKVTATGAVFEQRFNVAASRARDRMVLVRSIDTDALATGDLKARLIEHFVRPFRDEVVRPAKLRELCQTSFERELYDALVIRGYRVRPQVRVGSNAIDLVVEGESDRRLAIECDGDQYDGPDRWNADMARQRMLERAGWTFWRAFASSFILQPEALLSDLTRALDAMGIRPLGSTEEFVEQYCEHREVDATGLLPRRADVAVPIRKSA